MASPNIEYLYLPRAVDPDAGEVLTFSLPKAPPGMTINTATGLIRWTPTEGQLGSHVVALKVTDSQGEFAFQGFTVTVSPPVAVPNVVEQTQADAQATLTGAGLTVGTITNSPSSTVPAGSVISQEPAGGTMAPQESAVNLVISLGVEPDPNDVDGDGFRVDEDCNDGNANINPGAPELCSNSTDDNCDGAADIPNQCVPGGPAFLEFSISQNVVNGGDSLSIHSMFFDPNGDEITPASELDCEITFNPNEATGTPPTLVNSTIETSDDTRGVFQLTCALPGSGLSETQQFVVIASAGDGPSQQGLYSNFSGRLNDVSNTMSELTRALADNQLGVIPGLRDELIAARDAVDLTAMKRSTAFAPEGGFLPVPDDAVLKNLVKSLIEKLEDIIAFTENLDPLNLTDADGNRLRQLNSELRTLLVQFETINPSVNGIVDSSPHINLLLAETLPTYLHTLVNKVDEALQLNGLALLFKTPGEMYTAMGILPGLKLPTLKLTPAEFYSRIQPAIFGLLDLQVVQSVQVDLIKTLYSDAFTFLENVSIILVGNDLLKRFFANLSLDGIITGASLSFHIFNAEGSVIEGGVVNRIAGRNDVFIIGPDQVAQARGFLEGLKDFFEDVKQGLTDCVGQVQGKDVDACDLNGIWKTIEDFSDTTSDTAEEFGKTYQPPDAAEPFCILNSSSPCSEAIYFGGFSPVYTCESFCIPAPVIVMVHNLETGGFGFGLFNFFPVLE